MHLIWDIKAKGDLTRSQKNDVNLLSPLALMDLLVSFDVQS